MSTGTLAMDRPGGSDVVVVGAGPYGLSVAAWLRGGGVPFRVFGKPVSLWRGMAPHHLLRSHVDLSCPSTPDGLDVIRRWCRSNVDVTGRTKPCLTTVEFCDFMAHFMSAHDLEVDDCDVRGIDVDRDGSFRLRLADGSTFQARAVVLATGLTGAAHLPDGWETYAQVVHSGQLRDPDQMARRRVLVVGGGQSAAEAALDARDWAAAAMLASRRELSFRDIHRAVTPERADLMRFLRDEFRNKPLEYRRQNLGTLLPPRIETDFEPMLRDGVELVTGSIAGLEESSDGITVRFADGGERRVDLIVAATGYRPSLGRSTPELGSGLARRLRGVNGSVDGLPNLAPDGTSVVPGLFFVGALSALRFGPQANFIFGTDVIVPRTVQSVRQFLAGTEVTQRVGGVAG